MKIIFNNEHHFLVDRHGKLWQIVQVIDEDDLIPDENGFSWVEAMARDYLLIDNAFCATGNTLVFSEEYKDVFLTHRIN